MRVVIGAAIIAATPAMAELRPINVDEMPRFSRMMLSQRQAETNGNSHRADGGYGSDQRRPVDLFNMAVGAASGSDICFSFEYESIAYSRARTKPVSRLE